MALCWILALSLLTLIPGILTDHPLLGNLIGAVVNVPETTTVGYKIFTANVVDNEGEYPIAWRINSVTSPSGGGAGLFTVVGVGNNVGEINVVNNPGFDRNVDPWYDVEVCAADTGGKERCTDLRVNIIQGEEPPVLTNLPDTTTVPETTNPGTAGPVFTVTGSDPNAGDTLTFALVSSNPGNAPFNLDPNTGDVYLTGWVDYEAQASYTLSFTVTDGLFITGPEDLVISIGDINETPIVTTPAGVSVAEDRVGTQEVLFVVGVNDPDNDALTYVLSCTPSDCPFFIDSIGRVMLNSSVGTLDYETYSSYTLSVTVSDGSLSVTNTIPVTILDVNETPAITSLPLTVTVLESEAASRLLHTVSTTDPENDLIFFYISVNPTHQDSFSIGANNGQIRFGNNPGFDYETVPQYLINVFAHDGHTMAPVQTLTIDVIDVNESPTIMNLPVTLSVSESLTIPSDIFKLYVVDPDLAGADPQTYSMSVSPVTGAGKFTIDPATGRISTVASPLFDFESEPWYTLTVTTTDSGGLTDTDTVSVNVINKNEAPVFLNHLLTVSVLEETAAGTPVPGVLISATDSDLLDTLTYSVNTSPGSSDFRVDMIAGVPTLVYNNQIDRDLTTQPLAYNLQVEVRDSGGLTDIMLVNVIVGDINEHTPVFSGGNFTARIEENSPVGTSVLSLAATDADTNGPITYTIDPIFVEALVYFDLDPNSGDIFVAVPADYETHAQFFFTVITTDPYGLTAKQNVTVYITNIDDNPPYFLPIGSSVRYFEVRDDATPDYHVGILTADDPDTAPDQILYKTLEGRSEIGLEQSSGYISVTAGLSPHSRYKLVTLAKNENTRLVLESSPCSVYVDTYSACDQLVTLRLLVAPSLLSQQIKHQRLQDLLKTTLTDSTPKLVYIDLQRADLFNGVATTSGYVDVTVLFVQSDVFISDTEPREFYNNTDLMSVLESSSGIPSAILTNALQAEFPVEKVFVYKDCSQSSLYWWTQTVPGIVTMSLLSVAGLTALGISLGLLGKLWLARGSSPNSFVRVRKPDVLESAQKPTGDQHYDFRYSKEDDPFAFRNDGRAPSATSYPTQRSF